MPPARSEPSPCVWNVAFPFDRGFSRSSTIQAGASGAVDRFVLPALEPAGKLLGLEPLEGGDVGRVRLSNAALAVR